MKTVFGCGAIAIGVLLLSPILSYSQDAASAEIAPRFNLASLEGDYAVINHYGANLALGIGTVHFDGAGNLLQGTLLLNRPTATGTRELVSLTSAGAYIVNPDGRGTIVLEVTLPDGSVKIATEDFVITRTTWIRGHTVAVEIVDEQREPSLVLGNGVFVTQTYTRRGE